jgi:hypothetical protein
VLGVIAAITRLSTQAADVSLYNDNGYLAFSVFLIIYEVGLLIGAVCGVVSLCAAKTRSWLNVFLYSLYWGLIGIIGVYVPGYVLAPRVCKAEWDRHPVGSLFWYQYPDRDDYVDKCTRALDTYFGVNMAFSFLLYIYFIFVARNYRDTLPES